MAESSEAVAAQEATEQLYLYGPERTRTDDESKVFRHVQRYLLAWVHALACERRGFYLDYGCGTGYGTELLATSFDHTFGVEVDDHARTYASQVHNRSRVLYSPSIEAIGFKDPRFDFISCIEMIEHVDKVEGAKLLRSFAKMLAPGGRCVITTPIAEGLTPTNPHHQHEYGIDEFTSLLNTFFTGVLVQDISMGARTMMAVCWEPKA